MPCATFTVYTKSLLSKSLIKLEKLVIMRSSLQFSTVSLFLSLLLLTVPSQAEPLTASSVSAPVTSVVIQKRTIVLVRTGKIVRDFPERKRAVVNYPVIVGPKSSPVLRKIRALIDFKNIFGSSLAEYRADAWLSEFDYKVNYNRNGILDITFTQEGMGAYPDTHTKHFAINLGSGELIQAADAFDSSSMETLAGLVNQKLRAEIQQIIKDNPEDKESVEGMLKELKIDAGAINDFSISDKGITFLYDAEFPHVAQAVEPVGQYFFSFAELKPYIKREGPLGVFVR